MYEAGGFNLDLRLERRDGGGGRWHGVIELSERKGT